MINVSRDKDRGDPLVCHYWEHCVRRFIQGRGPNTSVSAVGPPHFGQRRPRQYIWLATSALMIASIAILASPASASRRASSTARIESAAQQRGLGAILTTYAPHDNASGIVVSSLGDLVAVAYGKTTRPQYELRIYRWSKSKWTQVGALNGASQSLDWTGGSPITIAHLTGAIPDFIVESSGANNSSFAVAARVFHGAWGWVPFGGSGTGPLGPYAKVEGDTLSFGMVSNGCASCGSSPSTTYSYSAEKREFVPTTTKAANPS